MLEIELWQLHFGVKLNPHLHLIYFRIYRTGVSAASPRKILGLHKKSFAAFGGRIFL